MSIYVTHKWTNTSIKNHRLIGDFDINWNKLKTEFYLTVLTSD